MQANLINQFLPQGMDETKKQFAGMAVKKAVGEGKQDEKGTLWLCGIPLQTGPGSAYSRNLTNWMHTILVAQAIACTMKILILNEFIGSMWMVSVIAIGYYAMLHDMNITVVCGWGILCLLNGVFCTVGLVLPLIVGLVKLNVLRLVATICVPVSYFMGALLAVHLYHVSAEEADVAPILPAGADRFGNVFDENDPYNAQQLGGAVSDRLSEGYKAAQRASEAERGSLKPKKFACYGVC